MGELSDTTIGVLIVDDQRMFAESLARLLADERGIEVLGVAASGSEATALAAKLMPQVVLVDYHLPDQDGVSVAAEIKAIDPRIKVVMLTGSAEDSVLLAAIEAGCSGFVTKDQAASEVADAVRAAAAGEVLMSPAVMTRLLAQLHRTNQRAGADVTERECELLVLLAEGKSNKAIAAELNLSVNTIRNYIQNILTKLNVHSKLEAVSLAVREGIIDFPSGL